MGWRERVGFVRRPHARGWSGQLHQGQGGGQPWSDPRASELRRGMQSCSVNQVVISEILN